MGPSTQETLKTFLINYYYIFLSILFILLAAFLAASARDILREAKKISAKSWFILLLIFNLALIIRFFILSHHPQVFYDEVTFIETAENYYRNGLNVQNHMGNYRNQFLICSTGWPFLVSMIFRITGVNIMAAYYLSAMLSVLTTVLVFWTGTLMFKNENAGLWSAFIFCVYPVFLRLSTSSAMGTSSIFFVFLTLLAFILYFRTRSIPLLYFSFCSLAYTINIRQEAFIAILPLLILFFLLFHPDLKSEFKKPHIYICFLIAVIFAIPPASASYYGVSTGFYYFYESPEAMQRHIWHNVQYNLTYWIANKIQPISISLLALLGFFMFFKKDRRLSFFFMGWFVLLYIFYTINPSCDFSALITLDSWRNAFHLLVPVLLFAGVGIVVVLNYFRQNYPGMRLIIFVLIVISIIMIPISSREFIEKKTVYARENLFIRHFSGKLPDNSRIIVDTGLKRNLNESYMSLFRYTSVVPGRYYEIYPSRKFSERRLFRDLEKWSHKEKKTIFLYLAHIDNNDINNRIGWYFDTFNLRMIGGFGARRYRRSFIIYEITGIKKLPSYMRD